MNKQFKSVRINTANAKTLQQLKGIGPKLAEKIIAYRKCNGPLLGLKDLTKIEGINHTLAKSIAPDISWAHRNHIRGMFLSTLGLCLFFISFSRIKTVINGNLNLSLYVFKYYTLENYKLNGIIFIILSITEVLSALLELCIAAKLISIGLSTTQEKMGKLIRSTINIAIIDLAVIVINGICFIAIENNFSNLLSHFEVLYSVPTYTGLLTFIISIRIAKSNCSENIKVILEKLCTASLILMAIGSMLLIYSEIYFHIDKTTIIPHIIVSLMFIWLGIANIHNRLPYIQIILSLSRTPTSQSINEREIIAELHTTYNNDELVFIQQYLEKNFPKEQSLTKTITSHIITAIGILGVIIQTCQLFF